MISVFTPTHDDKFLKDCYTSLLAQSYDDWEWVVYYNGAGRYANTLPRKTELDSRVRMISGAVCKGVGEAKMMAVDKCRGDLLVELDHDDILHPDCLAKLAQFRQWNPDASLIYSDSAQINEDLTPNMDQWSSEYGWVYHKDGDRIFPATPDPYPQNISWIYYAPNHVRAFTRKAYDAVGGYNPALTICDDQDLMCRLYQQGPFIGIDDCLYYQRVHPGMSQKTYNADIQTKTEELYEKYIEDVALAWSRRNGLVNLELGAAHNSVCKDYVPVDLALGTDVFKYLWSLDDNSVGVIRAVDFLEHIGQVSNNAPIGIPARVHLFNEFHRVLAHGGLLLSMTPSTDGRGAFQDPTHVAFYNENSFWYYTDPNYAKYVPEIKCKFQVSSLKSMFPGEFERINHIPYVQANLIAIKDGPRQGGILKWEP
jgi:SAM-dependent methyltransferase